MTRYDENGFPVSRSGFKMSKKMIIVSAFLGVALLLGSAAAFIAITGTSTGNVTATAANLKIVGTVTSSTGASCSISGQTTFTCTGFSVSLAGVETETFQVQNTGQTAASGITTATSGITPSDATCTVSGSANIAPQATVTYTLTYTAGATTGAAACDATVG